MKHTQGEVINTFIGSRDWDDVTEADCTDRRTVRLEAGTLWSHPGAPVGNIQAEWHDMTTCIVTDPESRMGKAIIARVEAQGLDWFSA